MKIANFRWINKNSINVQDNYSKRQILGGLMRLFEHQLNHTEFVTKTAQSKPTFGGVLS